jgi:undecaprenyl-diphosphatase
LNFIEAVLLGLIQGLSEFLPISSTAHLTLVGKMMGLVDPAAPEKWTAFIAVIQLGTLLAVLVYFFKDIYHIIKAFLRDNFTERKKFSEQGINSRLGWFILIGSIPVVVIGLSFKKVIEGNLTKDLWVIAGSLIALAVVLTIAEKTARFKKEIKDISLWDAFIIGFAQSFALIPGSSRSGTTIAGGLFMGMKRDAAARFSFLLSIPAVLGSGLLELKESLPYLDRHLALDMIFATVVAAISGYMAIDFLLKYLKKNTTFIFVYYRIALGLIIILLLLSKNIQP